MMEPFFDRDEDGVAGFGLVDDTRVSGDGKGILMEFDERISSGLENWVNDGGSVMHLNGVESGSGFVDDGKIVPKLVESGVEKNVSEVGELHAINLVVDLSHCSTKESDHDRVRSNENQANDDEFNEKEGEYEFSDLVWGKVKNHSWCPGQIFNPSASTFESIEHFKKDGFLIAYFGEPNFAFNESFDIKPFRINFCKMANQSNGEAFIHAVNQALHEASRRIEFGLACSCLSEEAYLKIKSQIIINPGIRKESSRVDGGDRFSTVNSFKPVKTVEFMQDLAKDPFGINRLDVSNVRGQLSAFNRWKGYHQLQLNQVLDKSNSKFDNINSAFHSKVKLNARGRPPKRKHVFDDVSSPSKKVRWLSDLMSNGGESVSDMEFKPKNRGRKRKAIESNGYRNGSQSQTADEFLSQIYLAARNPNEEQQNLDSLVKISSDFEKYRLIKDKNDEEFVKQPETIEKDGFTGIKDSYWTDRIIVAKSDLSPIPDKENSATALILKFTNLDSVPSVKKMNEIFRVYGALQETETRVLKKKNCVKVVFEKRSDAETAFSSSGKFSIFGPALVSYCLNFSPTPRKKDTAGRKGVTPAINLKF